MDERKVYLVFPYDPEVDIQSALRRASMPVRRAQDQPVPFDVPQRLPFKTLPNLKKLLCTAAIGGAARPKGCFACGDPTCELHPFLDQTDTAVSLRTGQCFDIRHHLTCDSKNVIYIVYCMRCGQQGVGETMNAKQRLHSYVQTVKNGAILVDSYACSIHRYFGDGQRTEEDFKIALSGRSAALGWRFFGSDASSEEEARGTVD